MIDELWWAAALGFVMLLACVYSALSGLADEVDADRAKRTTRWLAKQKRTASDPYRSADFDPAHETEEWRPRPRRELGRGLKRIGPSGVLAYDEQTGDIHAYISGEGWKKLVPPSSPAGISRRTNSRGPR